MLADDDFPTWFAVAFVLAACFIVGVFVLMVVAMVRNARLLRKGGVDPLTLQSQIALRYLSGPGVGDRGPAARRTVEQRLRELDDLLARGTISESEHAAARAGVLRDI